MAKVFIAYNRYGTDTVNAESSEVGAPMYFMQADPRRMPELLDAELIQEDHKQIANLPDKPIHRTVIPWRG